MINYFRIKKNCCIQAYHLVCVEQLQKNGMLQIIKFNITIYEISIFRILIFIINKSGIIKEDNTKI